MKTLTLKDRITDAMAWNEDQVKANFGRHETDLYVRYSPELAKWLKENYEFWQNIQSFCHQTEKTMWLDIPFAAWHEKYPNLSNV